MSTPPIGQRVRSRRTLLYLLVPAALIGLGFRAFTPRVVTESVAIRQDSLLAGHYPLARVLASGAQFFTGTYVPDDGMGEGAAGPRAAQRAALYPHHPIPFLKMNGLGAQSCFECHNAIGYESQAGVDGPMTRKPGGVGGAAGFASVLFQNPDFPTPLTEFLRNPPHVFGTGYSQQLAWEMTQELRLQALADSMAAFRNPGVRQTIDLQAKGLSFGRYSVIYDARSGIFTASTDSVTGVHDDFIVRPFQNKGIASSVRHFVMSALDFHFSMQPVEVAGYDCDRDRDGLFNEMAVNVLTRSGGTAAGSAEAQQSLGNVAALSALVAMTRPPQQVVPAGSEALVARGQQIFAQVQCASCHAPTMVVEEPVLTIAAVLPSQLPPDSACPAEATPKLGSDVFDAPGEHPAVLALHARLGMDPAAGFRQRAAGLERTLGRRLRNMNAAAMYAALRQALPDTRPPAQPAGYRIDLVSPDTAGMSPYIRSYISPRLPASGGRVAVPLFSDLRLHDMGVGLSDVARQETDVSGVYTPPRLFLTRPLWGIADTPPYLHDGRARDLREAILMHASDGSEANGAVSAFQALPPADQQALIGFLQSLRLPVQDIYTSTSGSR